MQSSDHTTPNPTRYSFDDLPARVALERDGPAPRMPRLSCAISVICHRDKTSFPGVVNNVSLGGVRLEVDERLKKGDTLSLEFRGRGRKPVPFVVQWCRRLPRQTRMQSGLKLAVALEQLHETWLVEILETLGYIQVLNVESQEPGLPLEPQDLVLVDDVPSPDSDEGPLPRPELVPSTQAECFPEPGQPEPCEPEPISTPSQQEMSESQPPQGQAEVVQPPPPVEQQPQPVTEPLTVASEQAHQVDRPSSRLAQPFLELLVEAQDQVRNRERPPLLRRVLDGLRSFAVQDGASLYDRRQIARVSCSFPVTAALGAEKVQVTVVDLSPTGIGLYSSKTWRRGAVVSLLPPASDFFSTCEPVRGTIRYGRRIGNQERIGIILEAVDLSQTWVALALKQMGFCRTHLDQKRKYVRARTNLPVEARSWKGDFVKGVFLDVGRGGALLRSPDPWTTGEQVRLVMGPLGSLPLLYLAGQVVHQRPDEESNEWLVSVRFVELDSAKVRRLDQYILALLSVD